MKEHSFSRSKTSVHPVALRSGLDLLQQGGLSSPFKHLYTTTTINIMIKMAETVAEAKKNPQNMDLLFGKKHVK